MAEQSFRDSLGPLSSSFWQWTSRGSGAKAAFWGSLASFASCLGEAACRCVLRSRAHREEVVLSFFGGVPQFHFSSLPTTKRKLARHKWKSSGRNPPSNHSPILPFAFSLPGSNNKYPVVKSIPLKKPTNGRYPVV